MTRLAIPDAVAKQVLVKCRRRCCLCYFLEGDSGQKDGQLCHIDGNSAKSDDEENLVFLCLRHHNEFDTKSFQAKGLMEEEIKYAREKLHNRYKGLKTEIVIYAEGDFESQTEADLQRFIDALKMVWNPDGVIHLIGTSRGSIQYRIAAEFDDVERLVALFESKSLESLGVFACHVEDVPKGDENLFDNWFVSVWRELRRYPPNVIDDICVQAHKNCTGEMLELMRPSGLELFEFVAARHYTPGTGLIVITRFFDAVRNEMKARKSSSPSNKLGHRKR